MNQQELDSAAKKIARARTQLVIMQPFWASLLLGVETKPTQRVEKTAIDGTTIWYNPEYINSLEYDGVEAVLAADVCSCMLLHHTRRGWRDPKIYDLASDAIVNPLIKAAGFNLEKDAYFNPAVENMSVEQAYSVIEKQMPKQGGGGKGKGKGGQGQGDPNGDGQNEPGENESDSGGSSQVLDADKSEAGRSQQEQQWIANAQLAKQQAEGAGNMPANMLRYVEELKKPKIDWIAVLRRFFADVIPKDYQWLPSNRRWVSQGIYLPSVKKEGCGELVIAVDTSGSISQEQLTQFMSEINSIASEVRPSMTHVIYCDTRVNKVVEFGPDEYIEVAAVGGGGTDFAPVFKYVEKHNIKPKALLYLTDLEGPCSIPEPDYPTMWVTESTTLSGVWGETLRMPAGA